MKNGAVRSRFRRSLFVVLSLVAVVAATVVSRDSKPLLQTVEVKCANVNDSKIPWEPEAPEEPLVARETHCKVSGTYQAPNKDCKADVTWKDSKGAPKNQGEITGAVGAKPFSAVDAHSLEFGCHTSTESSGTCVFKIDSVECDGGAMAAGALGLRWPAAGGLRTRGQVKCDREEVIFKAPAGQVCSVTLKWAGKGDCPGIVKAEYPSDRTREVESTGAKEVFRTFVHAKKLAYQCKGKGGDACSYEIVSIECTKSQ